MSRFKKFALPVLLLLGLAALCAVFIAFRSDTALVGALSAAGTVAAAGFAALAAVGSMRAAADSSETARRAREATARAAQPRVYLSIDREAGKALGKVHSGAGRAAADMNVAWILNTGTLADRTARLSDVPLAIDLGLPETADPWQETSMVWVEYWDENRVGHWRETWRVDATAPPGQPRFVLSDSALVD